MSISDLSTEGAIKALLAELNDEQKKAVQAGDEPLLIFAGAGSGKTSVLTRRIAYLLTTGRADLQDVCALTFTKEAAQEMADKVENLIGVCPTPAMWVGTFHALGAHILRTDDYARLTGRTERFLIYDEDDQKRALMRALEKAGIVLREHDIKLGDAITYIALAKDKLKDPKGAEAEATDKNEKTLAFIYAAYEKELLSCDAVDFDDLIYLPCQLFLKHKDVLERYQRKWKYFLVDEYQDTSQAQFIFISKLAERGHRLTVVGDDDQCLLEGTKITLSNGKPKNIEEIETGDKVLALVGGGAVGEATVANCAKRTAKTGIRIKTRTGKTIISTPEHTFLALGDANPAKIHIILGEKKGLDGPVHSIKIFEKAILPLQEGAIKYKEESTDFGYLLNVAKSHKAVFPKDELICYAIFSANNRTLPFSFTLAKDIRAGMYMPLGEGGRCDLVIQAEEIKLEKPVYDIDITGAHSYVAEGLLVHNSIYGWRGADIRNILSFRDAYPEAQLIKLEQNYRSHQRILDVAHAVISNNLEREDKKLWSETKIGPAPQIVEVSDEAQEAQYVVGQIQKLCLDKKYKYKDFAILYRKNVQSRAIEEILVKRGIPYHIARGTKFYERGEIKDIISYLLVLQNPNNADAFSRCVMVPRRGVGKNSVQKVIDEAKRSHLDLLSAAKSPVVLGSVPVLAREGLQGFSRLMEHSETLMSEKPISKVINYILTKSGYITSLEELGTQESKERIDNLKELYMLSKDQELLTAPDGLLQFLDNTKLLTDGDEGGRHGTGVTLMTVHVSKGGEYPVIFVTGFEQGTFPDYKNMDDKKIEEERRLAYVAFTRAMEELRISYCRTKRWFGGRTQNLEPSVFIGEIPSNLVVRKKLLKVRGKNHKFPVRRISKPKVGTVSGLP